jgi:hypothetical protein
MKTLRILPVVLALFGGLLYAAFQARPASTLPLSAYAPSGALLSIESPEFSTLLKTWNNSAEQKRWLASDNYAGFSRSRLFDRLGQAQDEFATSAGLQPDTEFLTHIAGGQSILVWYDIGNLEFLYITRMPAGAAAKTPLLLLRDKFEMRKAGDTRFYIRTQGDPARTVAFAVQGDYLVLATREDLIANALQLMQHPADRTLQNDAWYSTAVAAIEKQTDEHSAKQSASLRMTLNLAAIVRSPYFRTYWIQQNITELKQYTAACSDLYRTADSLREERVLIPKDPDATPTNSDLAPVLKYLPRHAGVYRAQAAPSVSEVLAQLDEKFITRNASSYRDPYTAPEADLITPTTGDASALEQRIDEPLAVTPQHAETLAALREIFTATPPAAMLVFSTADPSKDETSGQVFQPIHTAIVLTAATAWNQITIQHAITTALAPRLSVSEASLNWLQHHNASSSWYQLAGPQGLVFAVENNTAIFSSDEPTLLQLLSADTSAAHLPRLGISIAGFDHTTERAPFAQLTNALDHTAQATPPADGSTPPFFSRSLTSLSNTFSDLDSEIVTQSSAPDHTVHQTVLYQWKH